MARRILIDERHLHRGEAFVSVNPKLERLQIYKGAYKLMRDSYGKDFETVQVIVDPEEEAGKFWLKPCGASAPGARRLNKSSASTRTLAIKLLLKELGLNCSKTERFEIFWDSDEQAALIDTNVDPT